VTEGGDIWRRSRERYSGISVNEYVTAVVSPRTADGTCSVPSAEGGSILEEEDEGEREAREDG